LKKSNKKPVTGKEQIIGKPTPVMVAILEKNFDCGLTLSGRDIGHRIHGFEHYTICLVNSKYQPVDAFAGNTKKEVTKRLNDAMKGIKYMGDIRVDDRA
jgi:hypothetical protein